MLAPAATIGRVLALSPLSFGTLGSATTILKAPMHLWALAAEGLDAGSSHVERTSRSCGDASTGEMPYDGTLPRFRVYGTLPRLWTRFRLSRLCQVAAARC
eukprot:180976-Prymnesium_polylepis.1